MKPDVQRILAKLSKEKVELSALSDFEKSFLKGIKGGEKISLALIKDLRKAEVGYKQNSSYLENALKLGYELEAAYKDLGVEVPNLTSNKIDSCRYSIKEEQKLISAIKGMYGKF